MCLLFRLHVHNIQKTRKGKGNENDKDNWVFHNFDSTRPNPGYPAVGVFTTPASPTTGPATICILHIVRRKTPDSKASVGYRIGSPAGGTDRVVSRGRGLLALVEN